MVLHGGDSLRIQWPVFPYRLILIAGSFVIKHFSYISNFSTLYGGISTLTKGECTIIIL